MVPRTFRTLVDVDLVPRMVHVGQPIGERDAAHARLVQDPLLSILMFPSMYVRYSMGWTEMMLIDIPLFAAATMSFCNFYMVSQRELYPDWKTRLKYLPFLMSIGIGLAVNNTKAVFEALRPISAALNAG